MQGINLNSQQRRVVEELDRNILLMAAAGTGKTNTLAIRVANIIQRKLAASEEIICLTFTNKACNEMEGRIMELAGNIARGTVIRTFHSFCYDFLRHEARAHGDLPIDFIIMDEMDCQEIIRELPWCEKNQENSFQALINLIKEYRGEYDIFSDDSKRDYEEVLLRLKAHNQVRINDAARKQGRDNFDVLMTFEAYCGEIMKAYDELLRVQHGLDFNDLINETFRMLREPAILKRWQDRFSFWHIDEVQDTSRLEYSILSKLFLGKRVLLCGDFFQTIYEWRGSEPEFICEEFIKNYAPLYMVFNENYRSTRLLLEAAEAFLENSGLKALDKSPGKKFSYQEEYRLIAHTQEEGTRLRHEICTSAYNEAAWIYQCLQELKPQDLSRVAVLVRSNKYAIDLANLLAKIDQRRIAEQRERFPLDFMIVDEYKFFRRQEIKDVVAALRLLVNKQDSYSLLRLLKRFCARVGEKTLERLQDREFKEAGIRITDILHPSVQRYNEIYEMLLRSLEAGKVVIFDVETTGLDTARDEIIQLAAIRIDLKGNILDKLVYYVKGNRPVGGSESTHHISDELRKEKGIAAKEAFTKFLAFSKDCILVGHNVVFDITIFSSQLKRIGIREPYNPIYYDTLDIFRRFYPHLKNHKLEYLGEVCQVKHRSTHDAFDDICATMEILLYAIHRNILPTRDRRRSLLSPYIKLFKDFIISYEENVKLLATSTLKEVVKNIIMSFNMPTVYQKEPARLENLRSLIRQVRALENLEISAYDNLLTFLQLTSLSNTELDIMLSEKPKIPIITVHQAKGSEFDIVFMAGLQEGVFPSRISLKRNTLREEGRLFYVAMTRAKRQLFLSSYIGYAKEKYVSRFLDFLPASVMEGK